MASTMFSIGYHTVLGAVSSVILIAIIYPYVRSALRGPTRPNVVSWAGWSFLTGIATAIQSVQGADWSIVVPFITTLSTALVAAIAIRLGYARFTKMEYVCIGLGAAAFVAWIFANQPLLALALAILADLFVTIPTLVKTYRHPETEPSGLWFLYTLGGVLGLFATTTFDLYNLLFPMYLTGGAFVIALLALRGRMIHGNLPG